MMDKSQHEPHTALRKVSITGFGLVPRQSCSQMQAEVTSKWVGLSKPPSALQHTGLISVVCHTLSSHFCGVSPPVA